MSFREWLFLSGPIGRLLQRAAEPGQRIQKGQIDAIFLALEPNGNGKSLALEPCADAAEAIPSPKIGSYFDDQDQISSL